MTDLTTLIDVKEYLRTGVDPYTSTDDRLLSRMITAASAFVESWLARPIGLANWQEVRDGRGGEGPQQMVLAVTPVKNILTLAVRSGANWTVIPPVPGFTQIPSLPPAGQVIPPGFVGPGWSLGYTFTPTAVCVYGFRFYRGVQNVLIQYAAGYDPIPADVAQATLELVVRKYRERARGFGIGSKRLGPESITYNSTASTTFSRRDMTTDTEALLWQYRQAAPLLPATLIPPPPVPLELEDTTTVVELEDAVTPIVGERTPKLSNAATE